MTLTHTPRSARIGRQRSDRLTGGRDPEPPMRSRRRPARSLVLALACAGMAMAGLDTAIVNVALPTAQRDLGIGPGTSQWLVVAYGLVLGGFLLLGGRLADRLGRRRIFLTGLAIFSTASLLAGIAPNAGLLIAARGVQGLGAALIAPAALSLLAVTFPEGRERDRAVATFGAVGGGAGSVGVVAGGLLTAGPGWRWSFLINVPAGAALIAGALAFLAPDAPGDRAARLDVAGAVTATGGLLLLALAIHQGAARGWMSAATLALLAAAVVLLLAFARTERRAPAPLVPPSTVRNRTLVAANATALLAFGALASFIFTGSLLMQQVLGYTPSATGLAWLATTVTAFVAAMAGGRLVGRMHTRWLLITGLMAVTAGTLWLARIPADAGYLDGLLPAFLVVGIGFGFCGPALQIGALSGVAASVTGLASGLVETMREIGGASGVAIVATALVGGTGLSGFHTGLVITAVIALLGVIAAAAGFARSDHERRANA